METIYLVLIALVVVAASAVVFMRGGGGGANEGADAGVKKKKKDKKGQEEAQKGGASAAGDGMSKAAALKAARRLQREQRAAAKKKTVPTHRCYSSSLRQHQDAITALSFPPSEQGKLFASASVDRTLFMWELSTLEDKQPHQQRVNTEFDFCTAMTFSDDGRYLLTTTHESKSVLAYGAQKKANSKEADKAKGTHLLKSLPSGHSSSITSVSIPHDASLIVTCGDGTIVHVLDKKGALLHKLNTNQIQNHMACVSPDGQMIAVATYSSEVKIWQLVRGKDGAVNGSKKFLQLAGKSGHHSGISWLCFSPDSQSVVTVSKDGSIILWDINVAHERGEDPKVVKKITVDGKSWAGGAVSFTADRVAAFVDNEVHVFELSTGKPLCELVGCHDGAVTAVSWSADGQVLASGDATGLIHLWRPDR